MEENNNMHNMQSMSYKKFVVMMVISFIIMYIVMFLNVIEIKHYHTSITRIYMAILMVAPMAVVMMLMMGKMYPDKKINMGITVGSIVVFIVTLLPCGHKPPSAMYNI